MLLPNMPKTLLLSITALMAALCCVLTMVFQIYVPATQGYFNFGEVGVYISALLFGPIVGALAGGIGSMLADIFLGFPHYAFPTLIIKGAEGFLVGYLSFNIGDRFSSKRLRYLGVFIGIGLALVLMVIGILRFSGELYLSGGPGDAWWLTVIFIPSWVWFLFAIYIGSVTIFLTFRYEPRTAWNATAMLLGGFVMITGYFLYQQFILMALAIVEVPANLMQVIVGIMVALPLTERVRKALVNYT
jgi:uncharacterized membrane protein